MIQDIVFDKEKTYMFSSSVDGIVKSWLPDVGDDDNIKDYEVSVRAVPALLPKKNICKTLCSWHLSFALFRILKA